MAINPLEALGRTLVEQVGKGTLTRSMIIAETQKARDELQAEAEGQRLKRLILSMEAKARSRTIGGKEFTRELRFRLCGGFREHSDGSGI